MLSYFFLLAMLVYSVDNEHQSLLLSSAAAAAFLCQRFG
jgi:hypothetical protein